MPFFQGVLSFETINLNASLDFPLRISYSEYFKDEMNECQPEKISHIYQFSFSTDEDLLLTFRIHINVHELSVVFLPSDMRWPKNVSMCASWFLLAQFSLQSLNSPWFFLYFKRMPQKDIVCYSIVVVLLNSITSSKENPALEKLLENFSLT